MNKSVINIDNEILGGTPVFMGTRVPIKILFGYFEGEDTLEDFLENYPTVTKEQALQILNSTKYLKQ